MKTANCYPHLRAAIFHWLAEQYPENSPRDTRSSEIDKRRGGDESCMNLTTGSRGDKGEVVETRENPDPINIQAQTDDGKATQGLSVNDANHKQIYTDPGAPGTHLQSENSVLRASLLDMEQRCAKYESELDSLITEHKAHRCTDGEELDILDKELEESFLELETRIEALFEHCHASHIELGTIEEMSKTCLTTAQPSWWDLVLDEGKRIFWLRGLLANALHEEFFDKRFFFDVDGKGEIKAGLTNFEKILVQGNSGGTSRLLILLHFFLFLKRG